MNESGMSGIQVRGLCVCVCPVCMSSRPGVCGCVFWGVRGIGGRDGCEDV